MTVPVFRNEMWYCNHCPLHPEHSQPYANRANCKAHIFDVHKIPTEDQEPLHDYVQGFTANQRWSRRCAQAVKEGERAWKFLKQPGYTVQDFLTDFTPAKEDAA